MKTTLSGVYFGSLFRQEASSPMIQLGRYFPTPLKNKATSPRKLIHIPRKHD